MKNLLTSKISLTYCLFILTALVSSTVLAHDGHTTNETFHASLHLEHIIVLLAIYLAIYLVKTYRSK
jgi:hypothetical protein